eukprot:11173169-Lingulodinium_polyedra.AAC.1
MRIVINAQRCITCAAVVCDDGCGAPCNQPYYARYVICDALAKMVVVVILFIHDPTCMACRASF